MGSLIHSQKGCGGGQLLQGEPKHLRHLFHKGNMQVLLYLGRDVFQVLLGPIEEDHLFETGSEGNLLSWSIPRMQRDDQQGKEMGTFGSCQK